MPYTKPRFSLTIFFHPLTAQFVQNGTDRSYRYSVSPEQLEASAKDCPMSCRQHGV